MQEYRTRLHQGEKPFEQELSRAAWAQQKQRESIHTLGPSGRHGSVRDHTFRYDRSPRRELERQQSFARSLERSQRITLERAVPRERNRTPARQLGRGLDGY